MPNFPSQGAALATDEEGDSTALGTTSTAKKHKKSKFAAPKDEEGDIIERDEFRIEFEITPEGKKEVVGNRETSEYAI